MIPALHRNLTRLLAVVISVFLFGMAALACCGAIVVDADEARERALRGQRDPVEGLWAVRLDYNPEPDASDSYLLAIVRNEYDGVHPEAEYVGVLTDSTEGRAKGEIKFLFSRTGKKGEYTAVMLAGTGFGRGRAKLGRDSAGRGNSVLDMREVMFGSNVMMNRLERIGE